MKSGRLHMNMSLYFFITLFLFSVMFLENSFPQERRRQSQNIKRGPSQEETTKENTSTADVPTGQMNMGGEKNTTVLDFEGDVIEGERKRPYIFIQTGTEASSLDSLLFFRNDFNDYHEVDKNRRPSFIPAKKQRK